MNIFEIFSRGYGRLTENNMSSALHYLLDKQSTHGLGISSLLEFLLPISNILIEIFPENNNFDLKRFLLSLTSIKLGLEINHNDDPQRQNRRTDIIIEWRIQVRSATRLSD